VRPALPRVLVRDGGAGGLGRFGRGRTLHRIFTCHFLDRLVVLSGFRGGRVCPREDGGYGYQGFFLFVLGFEKNLEGCGDFFLGMDYVKHDDVGLEHGVLDGSAVTVRIRLLAPLGFIFLGIFSCTIEMRSRLPDDTTQFRAPEPVITTPPSSSKRDASSPTARPTYVSTPWMKKRGIRASVTRKNALI
jgi:hypothetical protein